MSAPMLTIELPPQTRALIERMRGLSAQIVEGIKAGMIQAAERTVTDIRNRRITDSRGPFPAGQHRLGFKSLDLRDSLYAETDAINKGGKANVITSIGTPLKYARIHELGGTIQRTTKPGKVRLRTNKKGQLLRNANMGAIFARKGHTLAREVAYEGGKSYKITIPARAPIGHGVADNLPSFSAEITKAIQALKKANNL